MLGFLNKFLDSNEKQVNKLWPLVEEVNSFEKRIEKLSDAKLKEKTQEFKKRLEKGENLDDILPEAFAVVREAGKRTLGQRHYDVQILAGIVLHQGKIAEQKTGEGKTLTASLPLYLNSLTGKGVQLATVNDYLARLGLGWMGPIYSALGITAGCIMQEAAYLYDPKFEDKNQDDWRLKHLKPVDKKEAYRADITYGTNNEFGFDYLRDNMVWNLDDVAQINHNFAIVDEADSILIDEARTPLIISAPAQQATQKYMEFARLVQELSGQTDYVIDEKLKTANLTEHGITKVEKRLGVTNLYEKDFASIHHIQQALRARTLFQKDTDYVVKDGQIVIVDEFTGRLMPGRRWSEGLHQAIEAKEGVNIQQESQTLATISFQNYFRLYEKLGGMTGTAVTEAEEFHKIYKLEVVVIPTNKPMIRKDQSDVVYKTNKAKFTAVANDITEKNKEGRPVLIGTTSIEKNEIMASLLKRKGVGHQILNAKNHQREAEIISQAGKKGAVTLATNIAGRGVDIIMGGAPPTDKHGLPHKKGKEYEKWKKAHEEVLASGGLYVIGTERHEARRIDNQLRGRSGRQGDPGSSRFYVSLEDDLMRIFGGEQIAKLMTAFKLPEDTPIEHGMVSKAIENAQVKVETHNFDIRKHLVEYDDVANRQREIIYGKRKQVLEAAKDKEKAKETSTEIREKIQNEIANLVLINTSEKEGANVKQIVREFSTIIPFDEASQEKLSADISKQSPEKITEMLSNIADKLYEDREKSLGPATSQDIEKFVSLSVIDTLWIEHLDTLDDLREGIGLRAAGQRDPLVEYKAEAFNLFDKLVSKIDYEIVRRIYKVQLREEPAIEKLEEKGVEVHPQVETFGEAKPPAPPGNGQLPEITEKDPNEMSNEELDQAIATLEAQEKKSGSEATQNPFESALQKQTIKVQKIGRNDPCPCGSGLKWKKCGFINAPGHKS
ncbi:preprotein translocase subunit SecA [Candidatus Curtissbacteria bacterium]|nr:preprotein translocase subunit SecA [Candidatus Curtissbacteria bacterium]